MKNGRESESLRVETPRGAIIARCVKDPNYPGITINVGKDRRDVLVEYNSTTKKFAVYVWEEGAEDYTFKAEY